MQLFDSHAHYFDQRFATDEEGPTADALLPRLFSEEGGVGRIVNVGTNLDSSAIALEQAAKYEGMYAAVGIHPEDCQLLDDPDEQLRGLRRLLGDATLDGQKARRQKKIVALGEIGLDYYERDWLPVNKPLQAFYFEEQLKLAQKLSLPVIIHDREAHGDCLETVLRYPGLRGVFHSFSASAEMARELYRRGWYISFSGVVTFKNASRVQAVAASVPLDRLLVETDAPYLPPVPHRGKMNHSGYLVHTAEVMAQIRGVTAEEIAELTYRNACRIFGLSDN